MAAILKVSRQIESPTPIGIYLKNTPAKFHPDPIWNDGALGFFKGGRPKFPTTTKRATKWVAIWDQFL